MTRPCVLTLLALAVFLFSAVFVSYVWLGTDAPWLHPELLGTAAYVWIAPQTDTLPALLRKVFDWKAFDPNVNRVRPINDAAEVVDAIARPHLTVLLGPHLSLTPVALSTAIATPAFLLLYLRRYLRSWFPALLLSALFISSIGFLSVTIVYIRPAKKLALLLFCACLYFGFRHAEASHRTGSYIIFLLLLYVSFFCDELALAYFVVFGLMFWRNILLAPRWGKAVAFMALPVAFFIVSKWVLPFVYLHMSVHGAWDALADAKKFTVFGYLGDAPFHEAASRQLARSVLSTVGVQHHTVLTEGILLLTLFLGVIACLLLHSGPLTKRVSSTGELLLVTAALGLANHYAMLLDWYPFPHEISYLGSFNYYYHSPMSALVVLWFAALWRVLSVSRLATLVMPRLRTMRMGVLAGVVAIIVLNLGMFERVNRLAQTIHTYPFAAGMLRSTLANMVPTQQVVTFVTTRDRLEGQFEKDLHAVFGEHWQQNGFVGMLGMVKGHPILSRDHLHHLVRAYYPWREVVITVRDLDQGDTTRPSFSQPK